MPTANIDITFIGKSLNHCGQIQLQRYRVRCSVIP
jgi:hypothetical protein